MESSGRFTLPNEVEPEVVHAARQPGSYAFNCVLSFPRNVSAELKLRGQLRRDDFAKLKRYIESLEEAFDEGEDI